MIAESLASLLSPIKFNSVRIKIRHDCTQKDRALTVLYFVGYNYSICLLNARFYRLSVSSTNLFNTCCVVWKFQYIMIVRMRIFVIGENICYYRTPVIILILTVVPCRSSKDAYTEFYNGILHKFSEYFIYY